MTAARNVTAFLDSADVRYQIEHHAPCFSAQRLAAEADTSGFRVAKTVVVIVDGVPAILVLPAPYLVDLGCVARELRASKAWFADAAELSRWLPGSDGNLAPPPLPLWTAVRVHADEALLGRDDIVFSAGNAHDSIRMRRIDWLKIVQPTIGRYAFAPGQSASAAAPTKLETIELAPR